MYKKRWGPFNINDERGESIMKKSTYWFATFIIPILLTACSGNKGSDPSDPPPTQVTVSTVEYGNATYYDEYPATVTALNQVDLRAEVSGYITGIFFKDGQHAAKGLRLYAIDQQQYKAAYDQALANLDVAKANLAKAQEDADRYTELAKNDAVARQTLDHAMADLQSAQRQVAAAEANVKNVETNLRYSIIYAPFDGTVGISLVKLGSAVTAGQTLLNTISSDNPMGVDCAVDEKEIGRFVQLLKNNPNEQDSIFTMKLPDQSMYPPPGRLILLDRAVDPQTGTIRIRVIFPNPSNILKPGLTCDLRVKANSSTNSLLIPYRAVIEQMGEYFVYVVNGNRVSQRRITLGRDINGMVLVKSGLRVGEQIVTDGVQKLRDNSLIAAVPAATRPGLAMAQTK
jgi:RND family efflux transporter MFP subunit